MTPWYKTDTRRSKKEREAEARALVKFWAKAGNKANSTYYKNVLKEIEEEIE